jgi:very-short-patch-repair endonuclease
VSTERAKQLRQNSSAAESRMWRLLYTFRTAGYHFRKQAPIGPYCADIACHHAKLVIELDGETRGSASAEAHDAHRDAFLAAEGYTVLRFSNADVLENPDGTFSIIEQTLQGRPTNSRSEGQL